MPHEHATPDVGTTAGGFGGQALARLLAASQPIAPAADVAGALASAFALLPGGSELAGEPQGPAGGEEDRLSPFSSAPFLPLSGAALARAASTPGPQGEGAPQWAVWAACSGCDVMIRLARGGTGAARCAVLLP